VSQAAFGATLVLLGGGIGLLLLGRAFRPFPWQGRVLAWVALGWLLGAGLPFLFLRSGPPEFSLGQWVLAGGWGISIAWRFDLLSQVLALPAGLSTLLLLLWLAVGGSGEERRYAPWLLLLLALWMALLGCADLLLAYGVWEVWVLAAYGLLTSPRPRLPVPGMAEWFLGTQHVAGYLFLAALLVLGPAGTLEYGRLGIGEVGVTALLLLLGAAWIRTAQVPFQNWASAAAGAAGAAGLMLVGNGGLLAGPYLWLRLLPRAGGSFPGEVLLIAGSVSLVLNAALTLRQSGAGPILAGDSASRLGLIWVALGLGGPWGLGAGIVLALDLLLSKAVFYPALAGGGLGKEARQGLWALGMWQAAGLPPSVGFLGRWLLVLGLVEAGRWAYLPIVLLATPLTLAGLWRGRTLLPGMEEPEASPAAVRWGTLGVAALLTLGGAALPWLWRPLLEQATMAALGRTAVEVRPALEALLSWLPAWGIGLGVFGALGIGWNRALRKRSRARPAAMPLADTLPVLPDEAAWLAWPAQPSPVYRFLGQLAGQAGKAFGRLVAFLERHTTYFLLVMLLIVLAVVIVLTR